MTNSVNIDLTRGHKEYDSKIKDLEGIFTKVEKVLDISKYKKEFQQIQNEVSNDPSLSKKMMFDNMQMDYEGFILGPYIKKLDDLIKKIGEELLPFYELYLLSSKINFQISEITGENIGEIIQNTRMLIDALNSLNTHNIEEKNYLIDEAYKTIYSVIMYEEIFDRSDILSYINHLNIPANRENIGRLLSIDLKNLNARDLIDEDLRTIRTEGLGYDYLNSDFIRKVSRKTVGERNSEYQERKRQAISELSSKVNAFSNRKDKLLFKLNNNSDSIKKLYINRTLLTTKVLSLILVPVITFSAGRMIGKSSSDKITEYKTITRTVDLDTGEIVGDIEYVYDENETTYVATVMECSPWRKNPAGVGYIRNVTAYEYIVPDGVGEEYHITSEDLEGNVLEKYKYIESKESLDDSDSTIDTTILIIETYQDKNDNRKSTKYIIPFSIVGAGVGIAIDVALVLLGIYDFERMKQMFEHLNYEIKEYKLSNQEIENRLNMMKEDAIQLQEEYNNVVKNYGAFGEQFIISKIDEACVTEYTKKRKRKKDSLL